MHDYSIDRHPKVKIVFFLAFVAIWVAPLINDLLREAANYLDSSTGLTLTVTVIPVFSLFLFIYWLFDRHLWKVRWLRRILLVPDLNGRWRCAGKTVLKDAAVVDYEWSGEIQITQSWSKIVIHLKTQHSQSQSISASVFHDKGVGYRLLYQYHNDPSVAELDLQQHSGSAEINFLENCSSGSGYYFTDRHRSTVGTLDVKREEE